MFVSLLLLLATGHIPQVDPATQLVERAIAARGKWNVQGEVAVRETGKMTQGDVSFTYTQTVLPPSRFRHEVRWMDRGQELHSVAVFDGKRGWHKSNGITTEFEPSEVLSRQPCGLCSS